MIYITGDTHRDIDWGKLTTKKFPEQMSLTKDDYVIILGDFGAIWDGTPDDEKTDKYFLSWYENKPWTTLFIDGNHENHDSLSQYPVTTWHGGNAHIIRPSVIHLMRGQIFDIDGFTFFTMGGANSTDKDSRTPYKSWWPTELPNIEEIELAEQNLKEHDNKVDFILTHTCPSHVLQIIYGIRQAYPCMFERWLDEIYLGTKFRHWYFGHHHMDAQIKYNMTSVYDDIIKLTE